MADSFDYIVVGAGSTGCVVAARLSEDPGTQVLVLEAGGPDNHLYLKMPLAFLKAMPHPAFNWTYWTEPEPHLDGRRMPLPRGKVVGGSGSINGMFAMRGHPLDYDQWAQMGASGWSFADVLPYFRKLEDSWRGEGPYHGAGGPVQVRPIDSPYLLHDEMMATAAAAGFATTDDLAGEIPEGFARGEQTVDRRGRRVSAATAYLKPAAARQNLDVRSGVLVRRLVFEDRSWLEGNLVSLALLVPRLFVAVVLTVVALAAAALLTPLAIGLFGISEILLNLERSETIKAIRPKLRDLVPRWSDLKESFPAIGRGTIVGFLFGIVPGVSHVVSTFVSYAIEKRFSRNPEQFGKGAIAGVAGPETANNATTGTAMIPLLGLDFGYAPETGSYEMYFAIGLTDF